MTKNISCVKISSEGNGWSEYICLQIAMKRRRSRVDE